MDRTLRFFGVLLGLAVIGLAGWAVVRGVLEDPSIVGSFAIALGGVATVVYGRQREKRLDLEQAHREELKPVYAELIDRIRGIEKPNEAEAEQFFTDFAGKLLLSGSDRVIKAWVTLQREWKALEAASFDFSNEFSPDAMLAWENVIRAIRKDLGHSGSLLNAGDLLRLYIIDIDELLAAAKRRR